MESRTLRSHRVVGAIADDAPTCVSFYDLGGVGFVCARVAGDAFQVLKLDSLAVQLTSPRLGRPIACLASLGEWTYCGVGDELWCFERALRARRRLHNDGRVPPADVRQQDRRRE